jgi:hypothetical protein
VLVIAMMGMGGGLGLVTAPATESIMGSLPPEKAGVGSAVNDTTRELGGTLGVAVVGSVFASLYGTRLATDLAGLPIPELAMKLAKQSIGAAFVVAQRAPTPRATAAITDAARNAFMSGFHAGALAAAAVAAVSALAAWFLLPARARGEEDLTEETAPKSATDRSRDVQGSLRGVDPHGSPRRRRAGAVVVGPGRGPDATARRRTGGAPAPRT